MKNKLKKTFLNTCITAALCSTSVAYADDIKIEDSSKTYSSSDPIDANTIEIKTSATRNGFHQTSTVSFKPNVTTDKLSIYSTTGGIGSTAKSNVSFESNVKADNIDIRSTAEQSGGKAATTVSFKGEVNTESIQILSIHPSHYAKNATTSVTFENKVNLSKNFEISKDSKTLISVDVQKALISVDFQKALTLNGTSTQTVTGSNYATFNKIIVDNETNDDTIAVSFSDNLTTDTFVHNNGNLDFNGNLSITNPVIFNDDVNLARSGTFTNGATISKNNTLTLDGSTTQIISGNIDASDATIVVNNSTTDGTSAVLFKNNVNAKTFTHTNGELDFDADLSITDAVTFNDDLSLAGSASFTNGATLSGNKTLTLDGSTTQTISGSIDASDATIVVNNSTSDGSSAVRFKNNVTAETFTHTNGELDFNADLSITDAVTFNDDLSLASSASFTNGATLSGNKTLTLDGSTTQIISGSIDTSKATLSITNTNGIRFTGDISAKTLSYTSGELDFDADLSITDAVTFNDDLSLAGSASFTKGATLSENKTLTLDGSTSQIISGSIDASDATIVVNNSTTDGTSAVLFKNNVNAKTFTHTNGELDFDADLSITDAVTFNDDLSLAGSASFTNGATLSENKTLTLDGSTTQIISGNIDASDATIVVNNSTNEGTSAVLFKNNVTAETFTHTNGELDFDADLSITDAVTFNDDLSLAGSASFTKGATLSENKKLTLDGSTTQIISGSIDASDATIVVNNSTNEGSSAVLFKNNVNAKTFTHTNGELDFNADLSITDAVTFNDDVSLAGSASFTKGATLSGNKTLTLDGSTTQIISGSIDASDATIVVNNSTNEGSSAVLFKNNVNAKTFTHTNGELDFDADLSITDAVTFNDDLSLAGSASFTKGATLSGNKMLTLDGSTTQIISGSIDASDATIVVNNSTTDDTSAVLFKNNVNAKTFTHTNGELDFNTDLSITDAVTFNDDLSLAGSATFTKGATLSGNKTLTLDGSTTQIISGSIDASDATIVVNNSTTEGTSAVRFKNNVTAETFTHTNGELDFNANLSITDAVTFNDDVSLAGSGTFTKGATLSGNKTLTLDGNTAQTISGSIDASEAILSMTNTNGIRFTDNVSAKTLTHTSGELDFDGALSITDAVTFNDDVSLAGNTISFTNGATLASNSTLTLDGTSNQNIIGNIIGGSDTEINITNNTGQIVFGNSIGNSSAALNLLSTSSGTNLEFDSSNNHISNLILGNNSILSIGSDIKNGDTIFYGVSSVTIGNSVDDTANLDINSLSIGESIILFDGISSSSTDSNIATYTNGSLILTDTPLYNYTFSYYDANNDGSMDTLVSVNLTSSDNLASSLGINTYLADALSAANDAVNASSDSTLITKFTNMLATGETTATKVAERVSVQSDMLSSSSESTIRTNSVIFDVGSTRLASVRSGNQYSGVATGDMAANRGIWLRTFGSWNDQDDIGSTYGFSSDTYGMALGADKLVTDHSRFGLFFSYAVTNVRGNGTTNYEDSIDTYQLTAYGDYTTDNYYLEGMLAYTINDNDSNYQGLITRMTASYRSQQWGARIAGGVPLAIGDATYITPNAALTYSHVTTDTYDENGELAKHVSINDVNSLAGTLDTKFHTLFETNTGSISPFLHLGMSYEFADTSISSSSNFIGQTTSFVSASDDAAPIYGVYGAGLELKTGEWTFSGQYDGSVNKDSISHTVSLQGRFEF